MKHYQPIDTCQITFSEHLLNGYCFELKLCSVAVH